ncbi:MAG: hypothetical protein WDN76_13555 [Alphaproteobacteria bacterium]
MRRRIKALNLGRHPLVEIDAQGFKRGLGALDRTGIKAGRRAGGGHGALLNETNLRP